MRTKLKDFKMPETWCIKIQPNNYKVLNNWRRSKGMPKLPIEIVSGKFLNHWSYLLDWDPVPVITFTQFRKYVYPNIIPPIEKRAVSGIHNLGSGQYLKEVQEIKQKLIEPKTVTNDLRIKEHDELEPVYCKCVIPEPGDFEKMTRRLPDSELQKINKILSKNHIKSQEQGGNEKTNSVISEPQTVYHYYDIDSKKYYKLFNEKEGAKGHPTIKDCDIYDKFKQIDNALKELLDICSKPLVMAPKNQIKTAYKMQINKGDYTIGAKMSDEFPTDSEMIEFGTANNMQPDDHIEVIKCYKITQ
jgi:hypothetical protein